MAVPASYLAVILIWSTTPLGIQWSGEVVGYEFGVAARMVIGLALLALIVWLRRLPLPMDKQSLCVYVLGGLPLFIAMSSVYWAAQYIPSGWISVIFGLTPILTSVLAALLLQEQAFASGKLLGMLLGLAGLLMVFFESSNLGTHAWLGVAGVLLSVVAHSAGAVLLKRTRSNLPALSVTTGSLIVATPLFVANLVMNSKWPEFIPDKTLYAILYLGVFGSAIGFTLYFYLLSKLSASRLALITLITPITALLLGAQLNDEIISTQVWTGTALILCGLALYEFGHVLPLNRQTGKRIKKHLSLRWFQRPM